MTFAYPKPSRVRSRVVLEEVKREPCCICRRPSDPAHIKTRGSGGPDAAWNVLNLCRAHHIEQGRKTWRWMADEYPSVSDALKVRGWEIGEDGKMWNPKLRGE